MKLNEIKDLIDKIDNSNIAYFEVKLEDGYVKMDKSLTRNFTEEISESLSNDIELKQTYNSEYISDSESSVKEEETIDKIKCSENDYYITSPMVGTFYSASGIDEEPYVKIGDKVKSGDILCIVEAMKLMNEIECEVSGEIVDILVTNGQMVEYGEQLFKIRRD
ncbi:acetyl-CoA carboxylase biotin carboxyl carrier protein [Clostridium tarantellae]|uniref:Biotin carboxyl carrier protein of acetyl-CoA carboxylase n=1 Tax=Clostridium tarantellae TaxID=39493 RepID=A0A6I1MSN6_9CLOT|nr:acetyl-CoA carboxylase biotin carboxyl carrier protein [Clostridium tarantellae]MPQ43901.1 acetyl-CoA carboxylase biotin carboxyl carrier protein [Clostridium tarantellae]